jgi:membrane protein YdbS with pleckstrin-like domain
MDNTMALAAVMGIGPALALMYLVFRDFTYPRIQDPFFEDRKLFGLFAVGMVIGVVLFSVYTWFYPWNSLLVAVAFALIQELVKLVILNLPRFQRKLDTAFYGSALGLGMGSTLGFGMVFYLLAVIGVPEMTGTDWLVLLMYSLHQVFLQSSTGLTIGEGVVRGYIMAFLLQAVMVNVAFQVIMTLMYMGFLPWYISMPAALVFVLTYFVYMHRQRLPLLVRQAIKEYDLSQKEYLIKSK